MSDFARHLDDYLRLRRSLGFQLEWPGHLLLQFVAYLDGAGAQTLTAGLAIAWAGLPHGVQPSAVARRLGAVRGFARYLQAIDPATEVPPRGLWRSDTRRPTPYLYSDDQVLSLLAAARQLQPPVLAAAYETLFGLLAVSGMRVGEALGLLREDVDLAEGVLTIRSGKSNRSRLIPLHPSTTKALQAYAIHRDRLWPSPMTQAFFVSSSGTTLTYGCVLRIFHELATATGLETGTTRPRIHDLRHSFAVRTLIEWHRSGAGIDVRMGTLSTYLGHVNPAGTYWYMSAAPELMELAAAHLDRRFGDRP